MWYYLFDIQSLQRVRILGDYEFNSEGSKDQINDLLDICVGNQKSSVQVNVTDGSHGVVYYTDKGGVPKRRLHAVALCAGVFL